MTKKDFHISDKYNFQHTLKRSGKAETDKAVSIVGKGIATTRDSQQCREETPRPAAYDTEGARRWADGVGLGD